ncbi:uncharacterized protein BO97DRAFT_93010 [Aspergillus homomorphus CBS 101889]|uniref:Uncharacterized protein n=1 Tax=Aspergillus homomorphus (strain CBS 101889) TaxID=1450537 RepID=A0A395HZI7_ASPHC|nr:hypothetical protein BO97DRAFT_93010 [Aspergillus homomorphus CBS 101889]RAL11684.1 hypothetical protein BO97DRAFT_93010 [Aspergillus homomorphus CBS 101889]
MGREGSVALRAPRIAPPHLTLTTRFTQARPLCLCTIVILTPQLEAAGLTIPRWQDRRCSTSVLVDLRPPRKVDMANGKSIISVRHLLPSKPSAIQVGGGLLSGARRNARSASGRCMESTFVSAPMAIARKVCQWVC